jgi:hypothetical protein
VGLLGAKPNRALRGLTGVKTGTLDGDFAAGNSGLWSYLNSLS